jgi:hypothetical protein
MIWVLAGCLAMVGVLAPPAVAAPPGNDSQSGAVEVTDLPFTYEQDTTGANANGPRFCSNNTSVFFRFTPSANVRVQVDTIGSDYDTVLSVYTRDGGVHDIGCNDDVFGLQSAVRFRARAGVTYYLMVAQCCGSGDEYGGGDLVLTVSRVGRGPFEATITLDAAGTADPATGIATISGTATCTARSALALEGVLRQLRQGLFVARGWVSVQIGCVPGEPVEWTVDVDTDTGVAFGDGSARLAYSAWAWDGFESYLELAVDEQASIDLG